MLQRIQSIYLLLAALVAGVLPFIVPFFGNGEEKGLLTLDQNVIFGLFLGSAVLSLITIFLFKNRKLQFVLGRLNIILNLITLGVFVYWVLMTPGEVSVALENGVGKLIPVISIVFIVLANKAIKRDEQLIKSVDRLR